MPGEQAQLRRRQAALDQAAAPGAVERVMRHQALRLHNASRGQFRRLLETALSAQRAGQQVERIDQLLALPLVLTALVETLVARQGAPEGRLTGLQLAPVGPDRTLPGVALGQFAAQPVVPGAGL